MENQESRYAESQLQEIVRRPASVANAIPVGVQLERRDNSTGKGPVLWEAGVASRATRHLLGVGSRENLETLRKTLMAHVRDNGVFWDGAVLMGEEKQLRALSLAVDESKMPGGYLYRHKWRRGLLIVVHPESQEVSGLLSELAGSSGGEGLHLAVLTEEPAALPSSLMRNLGFRVCFKTDVVATSRDVVGDESAATLPWAEDFKGAAVVYEESLGNDPEHGTYRVDLPGRRYGRLRDVYVGAYSAGEGAPDDATPEVSER